MKTVLYINGNLAIWFGFERNRCAHVYAESLAVGQGHYQPCAWLASSSQLVHLVIDSEQTEVDAYPLQPVGSTIGQLSRRKALQKTLVNRFPNAIIRSPAKSTRLDALLVHKVNLTEQCRSWLAYVEKSSITFCSVTTSAETIASLFAQSDRPYLVISNALGYCNHTFCRSGEALFTRTIENIKNVSMVAGVNETLTHLRTTELVQSAVRVYLIGCSDQQRQGVNELEWVDELVRVDKTAPFESAENPAPVDTSRQVESRPFDVLAHIARHALKQTPRTWHSLRRYSSRYVSLTLEKHAKQVRHRRNLQQLAAVAALAVCSIGYSGSKQWHDHQKQSEHVRSMSAISKTIDETRQALIDETPLGLALSTALIDSQALNANMGPDSETLLTTIAGVFTKHRELILQELSWVTIDDADTYEAEFNRGVALQISHRHRVDTENPNLSKLAVNVVGKINATATLRKQQSALDAVVAMLEQHDSIANLIVLEAPLTKVANNDRIGADALDLATGFRIQFQFDRRSPHEV